MVGGSGGTTRTGAVDDLRRLAEICAAENLWLHVDAAYGGFFQLTGRGREALDGIQAADSIMKAPIYLDDTAGLSALELRSRARRLKRKYDIQLVVIDYLQMMNYPQFARDGRQRETAAISGALKGLAKELQVPVLVLSQLSRAPETRGDRKAVPRLSDLRDSGSLEQDADVVLFVYREEYYLQNKEPDPGTSEYTDWKMKFDNAVGKADVIISKQRHGPTGTVSLGFTPQFTRFSDLVEDDHLPERFD